jgi:hypothetical protein
MGLDMVQWNTFSVKEGFECADLIYRIRSEFFWLELDLSSAEALDIGQTRVSTDFDIVLFAGTNCVHHDNGITSMEAASHISMVDEWNDFIIGTADEVAVL